MHTITLCKDDNCNVVKHTLKANEVYQRCQLDKQKPGSIISRMKIEIVRKSTYNGMIPLKCVDQDGAWKMISRTVKCESTTTLKFTPYPNKHIYDVYIVSCEDYEQEFADEGKNNIFVKLK